MGLVMIKYACFYGPHAEFFPAYKTRTLIQCSVVIHDDVVPVLYGANGRFDLRRVKVAFQYFRSG